DCLHFCVRVAKSVKSAGDLLQAFDVVAERETIAHRRIPPAVRHRQRPAAVEEKRTLLIDYDLDGLQLKAVHGRLRRLAGIDWNYCDGHLRILRGRITHCGSSDQGLFNWCAWAL